MDEQPRRLTDSWPLLVTCAGFVLMGIFIVAGTDDPTAGWLFVVVGGVVIAATVVRAAATALRGSRD